MSAPEWWIKALTETVYGVRKNARGIADADKWDLPGIKAAVVRLLDNTSPVDVARVMVNGADNPKMLTPGGVTAPGPQWGDTTRATVKAPTFCPDHPQTPVTKCPCQQEQARHATGKPESFTDLVRAARQQAQAGREQDREENRAASQAAFEHISGRAAQMAQALKNQEDQP